MSIITWLQGLFGRRQPANRPAPGAPRSVEFQSPQEERLTRKLAQVVGCGVAQALPAVRREIGFAPHQSDETLVKRAAYHYRQELPEKACPVFRDAAPG